MSRVAFDFGIIQIYWYSIMILLGVFAAASVVVKEAKRIGLNEDEMLDMLMNTVIAGIIGARLYYVIFNLSNFRSNLLEIFEVWNGGLAIHGGILFGIAYIFIYTRKRKLNFFKHLDVCSLGLILGQAIGRWGNFFNQEAYGAKTTLEALKKQGLPNFVVDGMNVDGIYRQPTFLYESIWNLIGFVIMMILKRNKYIKTGTLVAFYLVWYSLGRLVIEGMRNDSLMLGPMKVAQLISLVGIALGLVIIFKNKKLAKLDNLYNDSKVKVNLVEASGDGVSDPNKHKIKIFNQEEHSVQAAQDMYGEENNPKQDQQ